MGRPIDMRVPVSLNAGETLDAACVQAKVYFAEDLLGASGVSGVLEPGEASAPTWIRVRTRTSLSEPFARLELSVGCAQPVTRSYVVLADLPASPTPEPAVAPVPVRAVAETGSQTPAVPSAAPGPAPASARRSPPKPPVAATVSGGQLSTTLKTTRARPADPPPAHRLKLDPLDLSLGENQWQPQLRLTLDAPAEAAESPELAQRREAARVAWRVLSMSADDMAQALQKGGAAETELLQARTQLTQARQAAATAEAQLQAETEGRYTQPLVLGLFAALLAALGLLAVLWRKTGRQGQVPWWQLKAGLLRGGRQQAPDIAVSQLEPVPHADIDVDSLFPRDAGVRHSSFAPSTRSSRLGGSSEFLHSVLMDGGRSVATEELFDLQQQVEFFISLGQADQAVEVLVGHLAESHEPSPLAYLDLFKLYHELGRKAEYEALRADFNQNFHGAVPTFDNYTYSRRGLERYGAALSRIQSLWPRPEVLEVIERSIFRDATEKAPDDAFDLEAYRELLLLYGIARELNAPVEHDVQASAAAGPGDAVAAGEVMESAHAGFSFTTLEPLPAIADVHPVAASAPTETVEPPIGLDLDLSTDFGLPEEMVVQGSGEPVVDLDLPAELVSDPPAPVVFRPATDADLDLNFADLDNSPDAFKIRKSGDLGR